ncbi:MAG: N,N-dimethylformamidase beta subunit family domain-containing protein [Pseudomonadota bacterium]
MIPLIGYTDKLSARPGDTIAFKVSSESSEDFHARLVRVICADPNPAGPGIVEEEIEAAFAGSYPSRPQQLHAGSRVVVDLVDAPTLNSFTVCALIWPTLIGSGAQCIVAMASSTLGTAALLINEEGCLSAQIHDGANSQSTRLDVKLSPRRWYRVWMSVGAAGNTLQLGFADAYNASVRGSTSCDLGNTATAITPTRVCFASRASEHPEDCFNGKIESPSLHNRVCTETEILDLAPSATPDDPIAHWDFSRDISSTRILDSGPLEWHGSVENSPARAMTGVSWNGSEMNWNHAPEQYGAIHFQNDDLYECDWQTDFEFTVPNDLRSGIYAARIRCGNDEDAMPFFILPEHGERRAKLCVLVSTFTYAIYGNHARPDFHESWKGRIRDWNGYKWNPAEHPEYGLSTYNLHSDRSGIGFASHKRPLLNTRPGYITFGYGESGLRHFQADTHLIAWLENSGIDYDLVTDRELHNEGIAALSGYNAVTTGSHPEYHTRETLDALQQFRDTGGNLLYLGGNGFYWRIALHDENPDLIEIRRGEGGIRAWASEPGEYYNAFDGQYGGLWRRNGRPPQQLAAVGFSGQGQFVGSYYRRTPTSKDAVLDWMFADINDEVLGDFGLSGGGAAGFEVDRVDTRLGSPENAVVVARSENHGDTFVLVPEELLTHITQIPEGTREEAIRADMTYCEYPGGGAVFSVGSITFCGSLPHNDFDNNISTLLGNVLKRFLGEN